MTAESTHDTPADISRYIKTAAASLGLPHCAITDTDLGDHEVHLLNWLNDGFHGSMHYMERHGTMRSQPTELLPGTISIISVRLDYFPPATRNAQEVIDDAKSAYISRYALGRDYHKVLRKRLHKLALRISERYGQFGFRAFVDSAPVLEKAIAEKAGLGWIGKHSNLLSADAGSWFFLGELYTDLPLQVDPQQPGNHCGSCTACIQSCPTDAIVAPYRVDARKCISYLTIENKQSIPVEFRKAMGNRIYGCDDCQLVCPFNKFSSPSTEEDFKVRHHLDDVTLVSLFAWSEAQFLHNMAGSAVYRIGYERWLRNIAVALGNAPTSIDVLHALKARCDDQSDMVREHVEWALAEHGTKITPTLN